MEHPIDNLASITGVKLSDMLGKENPYEKAKQQAEKITQANHERLLDEHIDKCNGCALCEL